jgi:hypothetical protein
MVTRVYQLGGYNNAGRIHESTDKAAQARAVDTIFLNHWGKRGEFPGVREMILQEIVIGDDDKSDSSEIPDRPEDLTVKWMDDLWALGGQPRYDGIAEGIKHVLRRAEEATITSP